MESRKEKRILGEVFGVVARDGLLSGIPGNIPNLRKALTCEKCKIKLVRGIPKYFAPYMTEEQKAEFKRLMKDS